MELGVLPIKLLPFSVCEEQLFAVEVVHTIFMGEKVAHFDLFLLKNFSATYVLDEVLDGLDIHNLIKQDSVSKIGLFEIFVDYVGTQEIALDRMLILHAVVFVGEGFDDVETRYTVGGVEKLILLRVIDHEIVDY